VNEMYKDKLEILQQRLPIGDKHGLSLLKKTEGNLEKAEKQFLEEIIALATSKTGVETKVALRHLSKCNFDIGMTIKSIDEERYTLTELIIKKYKNKKEEALDKIIFEVEKKYLLKRDLWINFEHLKNLPPEIYCFITTMEWLNYESWEGYQIALLYNLELVTEQIGNKLALFDLANSLTQAEQILTIVYAKYEVSKKHDDYLRATNTLSKDKDFQKTENEFKAQKPILIEQLYKFVQENIKKFP
jgi:hypothetical protein